jgi:hypothetical protein
MKEQVDWEWLRWAMELRPETPPGKSGTVQVKHEVQPAGKVLDVVSMRNAIFMGQRPSGVKFDHDVIYRALVSDKHGTWMTDSAQEVYQCREAIEAVAGMGDCNLLIGGLGLGCYSHLAVKMTDANVTTVEISKDVIKLVKPYIAGQGSGGRHRIVQQCIYEHARAISAGDYDVALLDTWQPTGEICWVEEVIPLRRLVRPKVQHVYCWNEKEMAGQFLMSWRKLLYSPDDLPPSDVHYKTVVLAGTADGIAGLGWLTIGDMKADAAAFHKVFQHEAELRQRPEVQDLMNSFCRDIGSPEWENRFGRWWDKASKQATKQLAQLKAKYAKRNPAKNKQKLASPRLG